MLRSRLALIVILLVFITGGLWLTITVIDAIRFGPRESDPAIYWPAVALMVLITALVLYGARLVSRRLRNDVTTPQ
ncbi:MAG: hypothetical protein JWO74_4099 [Solirubrobacterales bacterium]|nr:hypothetical protein [Solirubrobacterales bacterium]